MRSKVLREQCEQISKSNQEMQLPHKDSPKINEPTDRSKKYGTKSLITLSIYIHRSINLCTTHF